MATEDAGEATVDDAGEQATRDADGRASVREGGLGRGDVVDRYVILTAIGQGGMGVVFAAYDPELDRKVALKLLLPAAQTDEHADARTRLLREAQALAQLSHPAVVAVHDVGTVGDQVWLAMEFIDGVTLARWIKQTRPWRAVLEVFRRAGEGLAAAHAVGLVHRDFKPENVMVGADGRVRVMDFGLARADGPSLSLPPRSDLRVSSSALRAEVTVAGAVLGTPAYMAPEQWLGGATDARTDQFAFCGSREGEVFETIYFLGRANPRLLAFSSDDVAPTWRAVPRGDRWRSRFPWERGACSGR